MICLSEHLIKQMADHLAEDGYRDAGYEYVSIDVSTLKSLAMYCCHWFLEISMWCKHFIIMTTIMLMTIMRLKTMMMMTAMMVMIFSLLDLTSHISGLLVKQKAWFFWQSTAKQYKISKWDESISRLCKIMYLLLVIIWRVTNLKLSYWSGLLRFQIIIFDKLIN